MSSTGAMKSCIFLLVTVIVAESIKAEGSFLHGFTDGKRSLMWTNTNGSKIVKRGLTLSCVVERESPNQELAKTLTKVSGREMDRLERDCLKQTRVKRAILPGTKWCGDGAVAEHYNDLGDMNGLDKCCRAHDHCPKNVLGGETKYGVENTSPFTWSDCECDNAFHGCLEDQKSFVANAVGRLYFNVLEEMCLEFSEENTAVLTRKKEYTSKESLVENLIKLLG